MLQAEGRHVLVLGRHRHVEVLGIIEDLTSFDVVQTLQEVRHFPYSRLGIVCQSTTPPHVAEQLYAAIQRSNPNTNIRFIDTICQPTHDRQVAVDRLLQQVDTMVVVGGRKSNNTLQLVERCRMQGVPTWHVQGVADLAPHWFTHCRIVGLTAGTSTLDATIDEVFEALCRLGIDTTIPAQSA